MISTIKLFEYVFPSGLIYLQQGNEQPRSV